MADYLVEVGGVMCETAIRLNERRKIVAWLKKEADECRDAINSGLWDLDMCQMYAARASYYDQAASMIRRGAYDVES